MSLITGLSAITDPSGYGFVIFRTLGIMLEAESQN